MKEKASDRWGNWVSGPNPAAEFGCACVGCFFRQMVSANDFGIICRNHLPRAHPSPGADGAALQRPQIALFGSSTPRWTAPLNPLAEVIYLDLECSPCFKRQCPFGHLNCLTGILPQQVAEQALKMLEETTSLA